MKISRFLHEFFNEKFKKKKKIIKYFKIEFKTAKKKIILGISQNNYDSLI
jgi:hypothetical protein